MIVHARIPTGLSQQGRVFGLQVDYAGLSSVPAYNPLVVHLGQRQIGKDSQELGTSPTTLKSATAFWHNRATTGRWRSGVIYIDESQY
jgi:hypothetical protein